MKIKLPLFIRSFFKYRFKKSKWNLIKEAYKGQPYDFRFFYILQLAKLEEMYDYFKDSDFISEKDKSEILRWLTLAIKTLRIGYLNGEGVFDYTEVINNTTYGIDNKPLFRWEIKLTRYVNERNRHRFEFPMKRFPQDFYLYEEKARCLYHKILKEKSQLWWD